MYILNVRKLSFGLLSKVTIFRRDGPNCILPAETAGMPETPKQMPDSVKKGKKTKELTNSARKSVVLAIARQCKEGSPPWCFSKNLPNGWCP